MGTEITWRTEERLLKDIFESSINPRRMSKKQAEGLRESIRRFGYIDEIIINLDNQIIAGHQRKRTLQRMGHKTAPVKIPSRLLSPREVQELSIRHNKNQGEFDYDILGNAWELNDLLEWGFSHDDFHISPDGDITDTPSEDASEIVYTITVLPVEDSKFKEDLDRLLIDYEEVKVKRKEK